MQQILALNVGLHVAYCLRLCVFPHSMVPLSVICYLAAGHHAQLCSSDRERITSRRGKGRGQRRVLFRQMARGEHAEQLSAHVQSPQGAARVHMDACAQAVDHYSRALQLDPQLLAARNNRAMCWLKVGRNTEAVEDCNSVLSADACNVKALLRRGAARQALAQETEAIEDFRRVVQLQPGNKEAESKLLALQKTQS